MTRIAPLGPARGETASAIVAGDEAAQREVFIEVWTPRLTSFAVQAVLDRLIGLKVYERFMLALPHRDVPRRMLDVARIERLVEKPGDRFGAHLAAAIFGEQRMILEETHHVGLQLEPSAGEAVQSFCDDGRCWFIAVKQLPAAGGTGEAVTDRRLKRPAAIKQPRTHPIDRLLRVLAPGMLRDGRQEIFDQLGIRIVAELDRRRFQNAARARDGGPKRQMRFEATRQPRDVIDDDDCAALPVFGHMGQERLHTGAASQAARDIVLKHRLDLVAIALGEAPAARLLPAQPITLDCLFDA